MRTSVNNALIMHQKNFSVAAHTDHPALNGQFPMREAAMMHNFGLPPDAALASLFGVPAKAMGFADRVGYIRPRYDADLVVWSDHPLQLGATPLRVWIDGEEQRDLQGGAIESQEWQSARLGTGPPKQRGVVGAKVNSDCAIGSDAFVLRNVNTRLHPLGSTGGSMNDTVVVRDGVLVCAGSCEAEAGAIFENGGFVLNLTDGYLVPVSRPVTIPGSSR